VTATATAPATIQPDVASTELAVVVGPADIRQEIVELLCEQDLAVVVADDPEAFEQIALEPPASLVVLIIDGRQPSRAETFACARRCAAEAQVVLVCTTVDGWEARDALAAGINGIVLRSQLATALAPCMQAVRAGQVCIPCRNRRQLERPVLSAREKQILGLVVMGYMNRQIADQLFLAESTVKSHLSSAFGKLEVHSRNEAVDLILDPKHGLDLGILSLGGEPVRQPAGASA
jgi:DNA-binding NarL/FixJ family response regulator